MINAESENCQHQTRYGGACHGDLSRANRCERHLRDLEDTEPITGRGTLYVVVNGRMVKASEAPIEDRMDIEQHDHKHGNSSATRYTRRALQRADHLGTLSNRWRVGRKRPSAA